MMQGDNRTDGFAGSDGSGTRLYNPYADLHGPVDARSLDTIFRLPSTPELLFTEEAVSERRSWSENLTYYTGCGYLSGAVFGGVKGLGDGLRREEGDTTKLRVNRLLNSCGHKGRTFGNTLGILGLFYAGMESLTAYARGTDDILNSVAAGLGTGALYKAASGPRTAAIAGVLGGMTATGLVAGKQFSKRYLAI